MNTDNTQGGAEPSPASAGSHNTHMATARLSAANTWLQEEIKRLRLTDAEREAIAEAAGAYNDNDDDEECAKIAATLHGILKRLG
jgi:hypothetical protein